MLPKGNRRLSEGVAVMRGHLRWAAALPAVCGTALVAVLTTASPAGAHVSVRADKPVVGRFTKLTFRAPSESNTSATTRLEISIPQHPPVLFVRLRPHPGWKVKAKRKKLDRPQTFDGERVDSLVTKIILTAKKGKGIPPRQFDEFDLTVGPLPEVRVLEFPVKQEYDNGRKVAWNQPWTGPEQMPPIRYRASSCATWPDLIRRPDRHPTRWPDGSPAAGSAWPPSRSEYCCCAAPPKTSPEPEAPTPQAERALRARCGPARSVGRPVPRRLR